jgi:RNA 2',3'-cyclic 3'-phosphodiesterase
MSSDGFIAGSAVDHFTRQEALRALAQRPALPILLCSTLRMRLFVALDLDAGIRERIAAFVDENRALAPQARWASPKSLHVTLKFIGEKTDGEMQQIQNALASVATARFEFSFRGSGFFPTPKSARVFWIGIDAGPDLARLAQKIETTLAELGIPIEKRAFSPHLTLARAGNRSGAPGRLPDDRANQVFAALRRKLEASPAQEFGTMPAREFFLYRSRLSSQGAEYTKLARFPLIDQ